MGNGKFKYDHIDIEHEERISIEKYFDLYKNDHADKIEIEINKIKEMLKSIE